METPVLLPVSAVAEFMYCPRNFYYRMVEGAEERNAAMLDGALQEQSREERSRQLRGDAVQLRQIRIASQYYGLTAELDVVEELEGSCYPVEYKRGEYKESVADDVQVCCQALLLEESQAKDVTNAYVHYAASNRRRKVPLTPELRDLTLQTIEMARNALSGGAVPEPLDDERCEGCSLAARCLPGEVAFLQGKSEQPRRIVPSTEIGRVLYVDTYGAYLRKREGYIQVTKEKELLHEIPMTAVDQVVLVGQVNATTPLLNELLHKGVPVYFCQYGGRLNGWLQPMWGKNSLLRIAQVRAYDDPATAIRLARAFVRGKLSNYRTLLLRYHRATENRQLADAAATIAKTLNSLDSQETLDALRGAEGYASRIWFEAMPGMLRRSETDFFFAGRNRRPPRDPVNAMLSFGYSMLAKDLIGELMRIGLDPYVGFLHSAVYGRPALALDLMEEFRPIIVDSAVLTAINTNMIGPENFEANELSCMMDEKGRKSFFQAYRNRMNEEIVHPIFGYKLSYRRTLELQARMLAKTIRGEIDVYRPFLVR